MFDRSNHYDYDPIYVAADVRSLHFTEFAKPLAYWFHLLENVPRPNRKDIRFQDLAGFHDRIALTRVVGDCEDMEFRIVGDEVSRLYLGLAKQGALLSDVLRTDPVVRKRHISRIVKDFCIAINIGQVELKVGGRVRVYVVDMPLAAVAKGKDPHILSFYVLKPNPFA